MSTSGTLAGLTYTKFMNPQASIPLLNTVPTLGWNMRPTAVATSTNVDRGTWAETYSQWNSGSGTPLSTPGGTITYGGTFIDLSTASGATAVNARAELRDWGHHLAPAASRINIAKHSWYFKFVGNITAVNPDTLVMAGLNRSHASGIGYVDRCVAFVNGTSSGQSANWACVCRKGGITGGSPYTETAFQTTLSNTVSRTLEIYVYGLAQKAVFLIDGSVVYTTTTGIQSEENANPAFIGLSIREPDTKFDGITAAANPVAISKVRATTLQGYSWRPGYTGTIYQNPW